MKKLFVLTTFLFFSYGVNAQKDPESDVVTASVPKGAKHLSREQLHDYVHKNYKRSQVPEDRKNVYQVDELLISFWDLSVDPALKKSLEASRSEIMAYLGRSKVNVINYSKIVKANGRDVLIYDYQIEDECYLRFQSAYDKNNKNICGLIQYKKADEDKAQKALLTFLESMHFKN